MLYDKSDFQVGDLVRISDDPVITDAPPSLLGKVGKIVLIEDGFSPLLHIVTFDEDLEGVEWMPEIEADGFYFYEREMTFVERPGEAKIDVFSDGEFQALLG